MPVLAIVGAGPGLGLAVGKIFGKRGFKVALISRNREKLEGLVRQLASERIEAAAFGANVLDRLSLGAAMGEVKGRSFEPIKNHPYAISRSALTIETPAAFEIPASRLSESERCLHN